MACWALAAKTANRPAIAVAKMPNVTRLHPNCMFVSLPCGVKSVGLFCGGISSGFRVLLSEFRSEKDIVSFPWNVP